MIRPHVVHEVLEVRNVSGAAREVLRRRMQTHRVGPCGHIAIIDVQVIADPPHLVDRTTGIMPFEIARVVGWLGLAPLGLGMRVNPCFRRRLLPLHDREIGHLASRTEILLDQHGGKIERLADVRETLERIVRWKVCRRLDSRYSEHLLDAAIVFLAVEPAHRSGTLGGCESLMRLDLGTQPVLALLILRFAGAFLAFFRRHVARGDTLEHGVPRGGILFDRGALQKILHVEAALLLVLVMALDAVRPGKRGNRFHRSQRCLRLCAEADRRQGENRAEC